jgi:hypothetical protein
VRFGGKGRISRRASLLAQSAHGQLQIQSIVAPPPPSRPRSRSSRIIPSTSTKNHPKHTSTNRHNGEFEPLEPQRAAREICERDHTTVGLCHRILSRSLQQPPLAKNALNRFSQLTRHQVLAVDLLNPTPAAYAPIRNPVSTTPD